MYFVFILYSVSCNPARQFYTSRDVICYEDVQPGIRGVDTQWREFEEAIVLPDVSTPVVDHKSQGPPSIVNDDFDGYSARLNTDVSDVLESSPVP